MEAIVNKQPALFSIKKITLDELDTPGAASGRAGELFQTGLWARLKGEFGWLAVPLGIAFQGRDFTLLVLVRDLGYGLCLGYVPMGPPLPEPEEGREDLLVSLAGAISAFLPRPVTFLRFDLPWSREGENTFAPSLDRGPRLCKSPADIQPPHTVILPIDMPEEDILKQMKHKTRYNIRLAKKKGVVVRKYGEGNLEEGLRVWYELYRETAQRDRIALHSFDYYAGLFHLAREYPESGIKVKLMGAEIDNRMAAGIIVALKGGMAWYLYGASSNYKRNYMPNHLLQWEGIRLARESGCRYYDFFGIPPKNDPAHPMYGLYRFKTGFGGTIVHRYGCYDVILKPIYYKGYTLAEKARIFYFKKIKKMIG
jgi:lipid II:glycine glycyltransferase (peptidoglycan interpeptide bridge formation enzyme)